MFTNTMCSSDKQVITPWVGGGSAEDAMIKHEILLPQKTVNG